MRIYVCVYRYFVTQQNAFRDTRPIDPSFLLLAASELCN